jgi:hypothetical protein
MKLKTRYPKQKVYNAAGLAELRMPAAETMSSDSVIL